MFEGILTHLRENPTASARSLISTQTQLVSNLSGLLSLSFRLLLLREATSAGNIIATGIATLPATGIADGISKIDRISRIYGIDTIDTIDSIDPIYKIVIIIATVISRCKAREYPPIDFYPPTHGYPGVIFFTHRVPIGILI